MASPQLETGYCKISNELMDALCLIRIPGEARQCLDAIFRLSYGFNKKMVNISISRISNITGLPRPSVSRGLSKLLDMNIIIKNTNGYINSIGINKDYETWKVSTKKLTHQNVNKKDNRTVYKLANKSVYEKATHKRHKDKIHIYEQFFIEKFWPIYPKRNGKKLGKDQTLKCIIQNVKINELDLLHQAVRNYANSKEAKGGFPKDPKRFIKNSDWFWRDWIEPAEQNKKRPLAL
jgi:phage replication O-like protein O